MMLLLATGSQSSAVLVNWIALAVLAISTYLLAERMGHENRLVSALIVLLLLSVPTVEFQTFSAYVDLFGTAFLVAGLRAVSLSRREPREQSTKWCAGTWTSCILFLSAAACGTSLGTKSVYDLYAAAYGAFVLISLWKDSGGNSHAVTAVIKGLTLVTAGLLLPLVFWFGRGYEATRNPLFPMRVQLGGHVIFPGYAASTITNPNFDLNFVHRRSEWLIYPWTEWKRDSGYPMIAYGEGSGLGAAFAGLVPVGVAFLLYRCVRLRDIGVYLLLLFTLLAFSMAWWFVLHRVPHFGLPVVVLMCIMAAPAGWKRGASSHEDFSDLVCEFGGGHMPHLYFCALS